MNGSFYSIQHINTDNVSWLLLKPSNSKSRKVMNKKIQITHLQRFPYNLTY